MELWSDIFLEMPTERDYSIIEEIVRRHFDDPDPGFRRLRASYDKENKEISFDTVNFDEEAAFGVAKALNNHILALAEEMKARNTNPEIINQLLNTSFRLYIDISGSYSRHYVIKRKDSTTAVNKPLPFGEPVSINDEIIAYLKENNLPYDDESLSKLSFEDVAAIMAGTYGKTVSCADEDSDEDDDSEVDIGWLQFRGLYDPVKEMLEDDYSIDKIAEITGLSIAEIKAIEEDEDWPEEYDVEDL